jgi:ribosomal protein S18 acetylase RimI-like enzyme
VKPREQTFTFGIEKMSALIPEIAPLQEAHWKEVEEGFTDLKFDVAYDKYAAFEERGQFVLFTVRNAETKLVGYLMCYVHRSNHAQQDMVAREDALYLTPTCRGQGAANALLDYAEKALISLGCKVLVLSSRHLAGGVNIVPWLIGRGFKPSAVVMVKELGK